MIQPQQLYCKIFSSYISVTKKQKDTLKFKKKDNIFTTAAAVTPHQNTFQFTYITALIFREKIIIIVISLLSQKNTLKTCTFTSDTLTNTEMQQCIIFVNLTNVIYYYIYEISHNNTLNSQIPNKIIVSLKYTQINTQDKKLLAFANKERGAINVQQLFHGAIKAYKQQKVCTAKKIKLFQFYQYKFVGKIQWQKIFQILYKIIYTTVQLIQTPFFTKQLHPIQNYMFTIAKLMETPFLTPFYYLVILQTIFIICKKNIYYEFIGVR
eukprot:TRINITY_DN17156_c0_g2_i1.p1 TRINITY_DN17156_c0_g2~~TRINITY_DN17156_c0_g2_i1.p1  ORF type:complete len:267 (-),score=-14.90 TRINITY_DN17156_c0_g2_i1:45-845(-)